MTPSLEDQLRAAGRDLETATEPPVGLMERIRRRRRRRQLLTSCGAVAVVVGATAGAIALVDRPNNSVQQVTVGPATRHHATKPHRVHPESKPRPTPFPVLATPAPPPAANVAPPQFYGAVGAGDERLAVISSSTGAIEHYLQSQGSQELEIFNAERTIAYQPTRSVAHCDSTWIATDLATGAQSPAFTTLNHPNEVAVSPDGQRIAYVSVGPQQTLANSDGTTSPRGCPTALQTLVVTDQSAGTTLLLPVGHFGGESLDPAFDDSGNLLAVRWHGRIRVLNLASDTTMNQAAVLPHQPGCDQVDPTFQPGTDHLLVEADCASSAAIDGYLAGANATWARDYHHVVATEPDSFVASYSYDASGQHLIYSVDVGNSGPQGAVYVVEPSHDRHLLDGVYQVAW
jgi:hypothetical protein